MSDVILTVLDRPEAAERTLAAARRLGELTKARRILALGIRIPPLATIMPTEEILSKKDELRIRAEEKARTASLKRIYDFWAAQTRDVTIEWFDVEGKADDVVGEWGRRADHVVLGRPSFQGHDGMERWALHAALFETDRPVLVVPPDPRPSPFGRTVAIAWKNNPGTVKAVLACIRWLDQSSSVHLLAGVREGAQRPSLPDILTEHRVEAKMHVLPITSQRAFGEVLLARAHELGADCLVLGAYVHRPVVGLILGGVTRYMLAHADLPLLMRH